MEQTTIYSPRKVLFGNGSLAKLPDDIKELGAKRIFILTFKEILTFINPVLEKINGIDAEVETDLSIREEPTINDFKRVLKSAMEFNPDLILGIGGGSVMDVAKLVAALINNTQKVNDVFGINVLKSRTLQLVCVPTTSGTGSEMSPNAILLDESENLKKGIVSPFLVPDIVCIDPELTISVPVNITAATGVDAFTHCLEAYINKFSHPIIDNLALEGMQLIFFNLKKTIENGSDMEARSALALGSMYGGVCLGPVNTAAIHALSYPLGSEFHIAHGLSNALLLPAVIEFNREAAVARYAIIARALGIDEKDDEKASFKFIEMIKLWIKELGIPTRLSEINIPKDAIPRMAKAAITIERLLKNNPKEIKYEDAIQIYENAY